MILDHGDNLEEYVGYMDIHVNIGITLLRRV